MSIVLGPVRWPRVAAVLALAALVAGCAREALLTPLNWAAPTAHLASYRGKAHEVRLELKRGIANRLAAL